jgi:hypothetical protein
VVVIALVLRASGCRIDFALMRVTSSLRIEITAVESVRGA